MNGSNQFQGCACCCLDNQTTLEETLFQLLDLKNSSCYNSIECRDLSLSNKYYSATIQLYDSAKVSGDNDVLKRSHAIILYGDGQRLSVEQLNKHLSSLKDVGGEPRILLCHGVDENCTPYGTLQDWCIRNGYEFMLTSEEEIKEQLINSLSAYKWTHRLNPSENTIIQGSISNGAGVGGDKDDSSGGNHPIDSQEDNRQLNDELMKKLVNFDSLLNKLSTYRDNPELRGNPDDKNIEEIAEILSGLLGDDVDNFLSETNDNSTADGGGLNNE